MDTNTVARAWVERLLAAGLDAPTVARRLGVSLPWLHRWLAGDGVLLVDAYDALAAYLGELADGRHVRRPTDAGWRVH